MTPVQDAKYVIHLSSWIVIKPLIMIFLSIVILIGGIAVSLVMLGSQLVDDVIYGAVFLGTIVVFCLLFIYGTVRFIIAVLHRALCKAVISESAVTLYAPGKKTVFPRSELRSVRMRQESGGDVHKNRGILSFRSDAAIRDFGLISDQLRIIRILRQYARDPTFAAVTELQRSGRFSP